MKLKKLYIHNIASISDAEIDFDGPILREEPLFLICGETGSGKTTILDAICLALYNNTPRLIQAAKDSYVDVNGDSITLTNPVQYLRKGTGEGYVRLSFESGGKDYIARWSVSRAYKKADGKFQRVDWAVEDIETHIESKGVEIEQIIGMGFEEFRRTVMLAQGEFTAFLKSKNDEKTRILEKITGTGIYKEIGKRITDHFRDAQKEYDAKNQIVATLSQRLLTDEQVENLETEIRDKSDKVAKRQEVRTNLEKLKAAKASEEEAEADVAGFKLMLTDAESEFTRLSGGLDFILSTLEARKAEFEAINRTLEKDASRASIFQEAKLIISNLATITSGEKSILEKDTEAGRLKSLCDKCEVELKSKRENLAKKEAECQDIKKSIDVLVAQKNAIGSDRLKELKSVLEKTAQLEEACKELSKSITDGDAEAKKLMAKEASFKTAYETSQSVYSSAKTTYEKVKESNSQWAKDARASLSVGDTCPVCGQTIQNQEILDRISDSHFQSLIVPVKEALDKAETEKDNCYKDMVAVRGELKSLITFIDKQKKELAKNAAKIEEINEKKSSEMSLEEVNERLKQADELALMIEKHNLAFTNLSLEINTEKDGCGKLHAQEESYKATIAAIRKFVEETSTQNAELFSIIDIKMGCSSWRESWLNDRNAFEKELQDKASAYVTAEQRKIKLSSDLNAIEEAVRNITDIREEIIKLNPSFAGLPAGDCVKITNPQKLWSDLNARIKSASSGCLSAEEKLKKYRDAAEKAVEALADYFSESGIELNDVDKVLVLRLLNSVNEEWSALNEEIGSKRNQLLQDKSDKAQVAKDLEELQSLSQMRDKWKALNDVFGRKDGEYFQKVAQGFVMNDILNRANHYLKTITKRYILESQPGSLEILVRDIEQGGVTRSTSTISGGESFIISLALALGLSSLGAGGNIYVDTLFIDEGFGTLSGEYLDTVTETLQKLNENGGKRVGIISHVKELRERIGAKIIVAKSSPTESTVSVTC